MSDFDKEAEREKLRKQFAEDEAKRESTERMSELLLQGATMTNRHCDNCGDPIFRYDGREFCPTCQVEITDEGETQATTEQQQPQQQQQTQPQQSQSQPSPNDASPSESDATSIEIGAGDTAETAAEPESGVEEEDTAPSRAAEPEPTPEPEPKSEPASRSPVRPESSRASADLSEARQSLARTITRFAKQAETADDLAYARECLGATEDAAEALEAVERVDG